MKFTPNTKRFFLAQLYAEGHSRNHVYGLLAPKVRSQEKPWIFTRNLDKSEQYGGRKRIAKPIDEQLTELRNEIGRVWGLLDREGVPEEIRNAPRPSEPEVQPEPKPKPEAKAKVSKRAEIEFFVREWRRIRAWIAERAERTGADPIDDLDSMRPVREAVRAIEQGIPARALLYSMVMHWPHDARREAGIEDFDFYSFSPDMGKGSHRLLGYILMLCRARIPVMLVGGAGVGKSFLSQQVAEHLELDYAYTAMNAGATRGDFLGRLTAARTTDENGNEIPFMIGAKFADFYVRGGVHSFEEMDAADSNTLILLNNAIANDTLENSSTGETLDKSDDFVPIATVNTFGLGPNSKYTAREKLDFATLDRFRMGRVLVKLDEDLVDFIAGLSK